MEENSYVSWHGKNNNLQVYLGKSVAWARVLGFDLDGGVPPEPQNPYPFLRVIFAKKGTHFLGFFSKYRPIFQNFRVICMVNT